MFDGSTRVFCSGAANVAIEIFRRDAGGDVLIGQGQTGPTGECADNGSGIAVLPALMGGQRIFPSDDTNGIEGPEVTVSGAPRPIPTVNQFGAAALAVLLVIALVWRVVTIRRRA